jgi:hypothetical protein
MLGYVFHQPEAVPTVRGAGHRSARHARRAELPPVARSQANLSVVGARRSTILRVELVRRLQAMKPTVVKLQDEGFDIRSVDVDKHQEQAMKYGIGSIPTFVLVRDGQEVRGSSGVMSSDDLKQIWR